VSTVCIPYSVPCSVFSSLNDQEQTLVDCANVEARGFQLLVLSFANSTGSGSKIDFREEEIIGISDQGLANAQSPTQE
jgi:hypothetical protein